MLRYSTLLKNKKINLNQEIHLVGNNNWLQVKIFSILFLISFITFMFVLPQLEEWIPSWVSIVLVLLSFALGVNSVRNLINKRNSTSMLSYLIFDKNGIRLNHQKDKSTEKILPIKKINRMRIVVVNSPTFSPKLEVFQNYQRQPILAFNYQNEKQLSTREVLDLFMHSMGLVFFQKYPLTRSRSLYEYTIETHLKQKERFSRKSFSREKKDQSLTITSQFNAKHYFVLHIEDQILYTKSKMFNSQRINFSEISGFDTSISIIKDNNKIEQYWMASHIILLNQSNKRTNILSSQLLLDGGNSDIVEFECLKEMDEIIAEMKNVIGLTK